MMTAPLFRLPAPAPRGAIVCGRCAGRYHTWDIPIDRLGRVGYDCPHCGASVPAQMMPTPLALAAEPEVGRVRVAVPHLQGRDPRPTTRTARVLDLVRRVPHLGVAEIAARTGYRKPSGFVSELLRRGLIRAVERADGRRGATYVAVVVGT